MVPNLFITVAYFDFKNFPWPTRKALLKNLTHIFRLNQFWSTLKRFFRPKTGDLQKKRSSPNFKRFFRPKTGDSPKKRKKKVFTKIQAVFPAEISRKQKIQTQLFQNTTFTKMLCGLRQNGPQVETHCNSCCSCYNHYLRFPLFSNLIRPELNPKGKWKLELELHRSALPVKCRVNIRVVPWVRLVLIPTWHVSHAKITIVMVILGLSPNHEDSE